MVVRRHKISIGIPLTVVLETRGWEKFATFNRNHRSSRNSTR